jgi:hypothetical protein
MPGVSQWRAEAAERCPPRARKPHTRPPPSHAPGRPARSRRGGHSGAGARCRCCRTSCPTGSRGSPRPRRRRPEGPAREQAAALSSRRGRPGAASERSRCTQRTRKPAAALAAEPRTPAAACCGAAPRAAACACTAEGRHAQALQRGCHTTEQTATRRAAMRLGNPRKQPRLHAARLAPLSSRACSREQAARAQRERRTHRRVSLRDRPRDRP